MRMLTAAVACAAVLVAVGCGSDDSAPTSDTREPRAASGPAQDFDRVVRIDGERGRAAAGPRQLEDLVGDLAGLVFIDTGAPFPNPPKQIVRETDPGNPENVEQRDYLQVEKDAWAARKRIGDIPVRIVTVKFSAAAIREAPFPAEQALMRRNIERQKGWQVLSPRAEQIVANTGHAVEEEDPQLVIDVILDVVKEAR